MRCNNIYGNIMMKYKQPPTVNIFKLIIRRNTIYIEP